MTSTVRLHAAPPPRPQVVVLDAALDAGRLVAALPGPSVRKAWREITRLAASGPAGSALSLFVGSAPVPRNVVDGTSVGELAFAEFIQPIIVGSGQSLFLVWTPGTGPAFTAASVASGHLTYFENPGA